MAASLQLGQAEVLDGAHDGRPGGPHGAVGPAQLVPRPGQVRIPVEQPRRGRDGRGCARFRGRSRFVGHTDHGHRSVHGLTFQAEDAGGEKNSEDLSNKYLEQLRERAKIVKR